MTRRIFKPTTVHRQIFRRSLIGLTIMTTLNGIAPLPAQANPWQTIRNFFRGDTGGQASGRSRGGATRDETCRINPDTLMPEAENTESISPATIFADPEASTLDSNRSDSDLVEDEILTANAVTEAAESSIPEAEFAATNVQEIVILAPETPQKTTQANPNFFLYVPFDRHTYNMVLEFDLDVIGADNLPQPETITLALPEKPGIVQFPLPTETPLAVGKTYEWTFSLICRGSQSTPETETSVVAPMPASGEAVSTTDSENDMSQVDTGETPLNESGIAIKPEAPLTNSEATNSEESTLDINLQIMSLNLQIMSLENGADTADSSAETLPTLRQEVYGAIERVEASPELVAALEDVEPGKDYEAYGDNGIWFDMVSSMAAHAPSLEWTQFLEAFNNEAFKLDGITDIDITPQPLIPPNPYMLF